MHGATAQTHKPCEANCNAISPFLITKCICNGSDGVELLADRQAGGCVVMMATTSSGVPGLAGHWETGVRPYVCSRLGKQYRPLHTHQCMLDTSWYRAHARVSWPYAPPHACWQEMDRSSMRTDRSLTAWLVARDVDRAPTVNATGTVRTVGSSTWSYVYVRAWYIRDPGLFARGRHSHTTQLPVDSRGCTWSEMGRQVYRHVACYGLLSRCLSPAGRHVPRCPKPTVVLHAAVHRIPSAYRLAIGFPESPGRVLSDFF